MAKQYLVDKEGLIKLIANIKESLNKKLDADDMEPIPKEKLDEIFNKED